MNLIEPLMNQPKIRSTRVTGLGTQESTNELSQIRGGGSLRKFNTKSETPGRRTCYRGTWLIVQRLPLGPYCAVRLCLGTYGGPRGGRLLMSGVPLYRGTLPIPRHKPTPGSWGGVVCSEEGCEGLIKDSRVDHVSWLCMYMYKI